MNFCKILWTSYKTGNAKNCKFVKQEWIFKICNKKWYVIDSESKSGYSRYDPIKFLTKSIESNLCDYSDSYILVTGNITVTGTIAAAGDNPVRRNKPLAAATQVAFKNCASFKNCRTEINDTFVDYTEFINIAMPMYNLMEYCDNYSDSSGSLWGFKRDEIANNTSVTNADNAPSFKCKANLIANTNADGTKKGEIIALPLKYLFKYFSKIIRNAIDLFQSWTFIKMDWKLFANYSWDWC